MKNLFFLVFLFVFTSSFAQGNFELFDRIAQNEKLSFDADFLSKSKSAGDVCDVKYHRCYWELNPEQDSIKGYVYSYFKVLQDGFSNLQFDLSSNMQVDSVVYHSESVSFSHSEDVLSIDVSAVLSNGVFDSVCVYYQGIPDQSLDFGSFITSTHGSSSSPIVWTLSEPYGASQWWPCKNNLSDKIDSIDVFVLHPSQYKAASNGLLVSENVVGSKTLSHWKHNYPIATYLVAVAVTDYQVYTDDFNLTQGTLPFVNYFYPEDYDNNVTQVQRLNEVIQFYDSLIAPYPFMNEKYGHAQFGWGGGMEHQTISFMGSFDYEIIAHELLHQWFGDAVTCGSWSEIWLNEGFATYFTALNYERFYPDQYWMPWKNGAINIITTLPYGSVFVYDTATSNTIFSSRLSYYKGAYLLHQLRWIVGDSAFFQGVRNYFDDVRCFYSFAKTEYFIEHLEAASGKELDYFFEDWLYNEGYPVYDVEVLGSDSILTVEISQTPTHSSVDFFEMPVPLKFFKNGFDTTVVFDNTFSGQTFDLNLGFFPDSVIFDPERHICTKNSNLVLTGIKENSFSECRILPNPVNDFLEIKLPNSFKINKVKIFDLKNSLLIDENISENTERINVSNLENGLYLINVYTSEQMFSSKFVVER